MILMFPLLRKRITLTKVQSSLQFNQVIGFKLVAKFHEPNLSGSLDILLTRKAWHTDERTDGQTQSNMPS